LFATGEALAWLI